MDRALGPTLELREEVLLALETAGFAETNMVSQISAPLQVKQFNVESDQQQMVAYVELAASSEENARLLNGNRNLYGGPRQKLLERRMFDALRRKLGVDRVRLQITSPTPLEHMDFGPQERKRLVRVSLEDAVVRRLIIPRSTLGRLVQDLELPFILMRNERVLGPSLALAAALERIAPDLPFGGRVLDPFAGTFLTAHLLARSRPDVQVISFDKLENDKGLGSHDAFEYQPKRSFDLVVIDPLYQDILTYAREVLPKLNTHLAIVITGDTCDIGWNDAAMRLLGRLGRLESHFRSTTAKWGQNAVLLERDKRIQGG
jgi:hypothetical protein